MKIAISGKGGVGKTTVASTMVRLLSDLGYRVLAIDADPAMNLPGQIGIKLEGTEFKPLSEMKDFIEARTGAKRGEYGGFFKLNPKVDDIPEIYSLKKDHIKVLVLGSINKGGGGCFCPENVLLRNLLAHVLIERDEWVVVDMDAGLEHLGRGTASHVDRLIVVVEPGIQSIKTAKKIKDLAKDIGLDNVAIVANKVTGREDIEFIENNLPYMKLLGSVSFSERIKEAERQGISPYDMDENLKTEVRKIVDALSQKL
ncbi:MAG: carbon monoxide dehydrogenase accessory protein CooC [Desulfobacterota bacterium]|nr:carbon monoxide dehydrogenase accessory protein CooC [Thermodesulfobacteriota bacterium]MDW8001125.1 carbon monoxide dehydrogenase accessory protein CooC [Deltaproteobacteria bacterium]